MGWSQAVAGDSITRSYLQFVSIKRDGPECLRTESVSLSVVPGAETQAPVLGNCQFHAGVGLARCQSAFERVLSIGFSSPRASAFQSQRPRVPRDLCLSIS